MFDVCYNNKIIQTKLQYLYIWNGMHGIMKMCLFRKYAYTQKKDEIQTISNDNKMSEQTNNTKTNMQSFADQAENAAAATQLDVATTNKYLHLFTFQTPNV